MGVSDKGVTETILQGVTLARVGFPLKHNAKIGNLSLKTKLFQLKNVNGLNFFSLC